MRRSACPRSGLSALDPGKQGLKHVGGSLTGVEVFLSALDPGKQGLKLGGLRGVRTVPTAFSA